MSYINEVYKVKLAHHELTGVITHEMWTKRIGPKGPVVYSRPNGPAMLWRDAETGVVWREEWRQDDKLHRLDGPAVITRDRQSGAVRTKQWYEDGKEIGVVCRGAVVAEDARPSFG